MFKSERDIPRDEARLEIAEIYGWTWILISQFATKDSCRVSAIFHLSPSQWIMNRNRFSKHIKNDTVKFGDEISSSLVSARDNQSLCINPHALSGGVNRPLKESPAIRVCRCHLICLSDNLEKKRVSALWRHHATVPIIIIFTLYEQLLRYLKENYETRRIKSIVWLSSEKIIILRWWNKEKQRAARNFNEEKNRKK